MIGRSGMCRRISLGKGRPSSQLGAGRANFGLNAAADGERNGHAGKAWAGGQIPILFYRHRMLCPLTETPERFAEVDVSSPDAKEKMRSAPILEENKLSSLFEHTPANLEELLLDSEVAG
jgi:hypothetical protein